VGYTRSDTRDHSFPFRHPRSRPFHRVVSGRDGRKEELAHPGVEVGDRPDGNLDLVAKRDTESAAVVVPADTAGPPHAEVVSYTNP
jgi:hypothetical protein